MYLDFDDHRPDTPRVPSAISAREGVILSFFFHFLLACAIVFLPGRLTSSAQQVVPLVPEREPARFVYMAPRVDRPAPPRLTAESSDMDRRSATRERAPNPANAMPFSRGDTREKVEGGREERAVGPETPTPASPAPAMPPPPQTTATISTEPPIVQRPALASGGLGSALRNLQRYLEDQNFDNQRGGQTDQANADIQFDSKGADFGPWLRRFRNQVMRNWLIPLPAMTQSGRVVIQFIVLRNGTIIDLKVVDPSPIEAFNIAAFNALKMSNPTMMLPADYPADRAFFTVTFHYNEGQDR